MICGINEFFLSSLEDRYNNWSITNTIGDIFLSWVSISYTYHISYILVHIISYISVNIIYRGISL